MLLCGYYSLADYRCICSQHTEEYPAFFSVLVSCIYFGEQVVVLFIAGASFQYCAPLPVEGATHYFGLFNVVFFLLALRYKIVYNVILCAILPVAVSGVDGIGAVAGASAKEFFVFFNGIFQLCAFIKGIIAEVLYKADAVDL